MGSGAVGFLDHGVIVARGAGRFTQGSENGWRATWPVEAALKAEDMFRVLMGEKVDPRHELFQKHALEVKEIDYHGA
jgi:hypothetical protein